MFETSACQRVCTVLALKFKPVCQVSSACSPHNVLRLALLEYHLKMLQMVSEMFENAGTMRVGFCCHFELQGPS